MTLDEPSVFDFWVDSTQPRHPVIGLVITSPNGTVTVPFNSRTAHDVGALLSAHAQAIRTPHV